MNYHIVVFGCFHRRSCLRQGLQPCTQNICFGGLRSLVGKKGFMTYQL